MVKLKKHALDDSPNIAKKPYEPSKLEIITFGEEVIMTSTPFATKGFYEKTDGDWDWDLFGDKTK